MPFKCIVIIFIVYVCEREREMTWGNRWLAR